MSGHGELEIVGNGTKESGIMFWDENVERVKLWKMLFLIMKFSSGFNLLNVFKRNPQTVGYTVVEKPSFWTLVMNEKLNISGVFLYK